MRSDFELLLAIINDIRKFTSFGDTYYATLGFTPEETEKVKAMLAPDFLDTWAQTGQLPQQQRTRTECSGRTP